MMINFVNDFLPKKDSIISNNLFGLKKTCNICKNCKTRIYKFNSYFFVTFNLENQQLNNNDSIDIRTQFTLQNKTEKEQNIYCSKCLNKTSQTVHKRFYTAPTYLIISIQRGVMYKCKNPIKIEEYLNLDTNIEFQYCKKEFGLIGLLGRTEENGNESFFSFIKNGQFWYYCKGDTIQNIGFLEKAKYNGDILMLFYRKIE